MPSNQWARFSRPATESLIVSCTIGAQCGVSSFDGGKKACLRMLESECTFYCAKSLAEAQKNACLGKRRCVLGEDSETAIVFRQSRSSAGNFQRTIVYNDHHVLGGVWCVWKKRIKKHTNYDVLSVEAEASQGPCLAVSQVQGHASVPTASEIVSSMFQEQAKQKQYSRRVRQRFRLTCNFFSCGRSHSNTLVCG